MDLKTLQEMKRQMVLRGNWKEVQRINKMIAIRIREMEKISHNKLTDKI